MRIITLVFYVFLVTSNSCREPFDAVDGQRSFVTGNIIDSEGNGVEGFDVQIKSVDRVIGVTTTEKNGDFEAVILDDIDGTSWMVVEPLYNNVAQTSFKLNYRYNETQFSRTYNTIPITVSQKARVFLDIDVINASEVQARISFTLADCSINFQNDILESSNCFEIFERELFSFQGNIINVPLNTEFKITVQADGETTEYMYLIDENDYEIQLSV